jgi:VWFA-related protein
VEIMTIERYQAVVNILRRIPATLGLCTSLFLLMSSARQVPAQPQAPISMTANVATAYVAVEGKSGKTTQELRPEDFSVQQKGVPLKILAVETATNTPLLFATMLDLSGSANVEHRRDFLQILYNFFARNIRKSDRVSVVAFARSTYRTTAMTGSLVELKAGFQEIAEGQPIGPTALYDSLFTVSDTLSQDMHGRPVILVVSDFQDNASHRKLEETILHLRGMGLAVFPLVPREGRSEHSRGWKDGWMVAERIAKETGGIAHSFESPEELGTALTQVHTLLEDSYLLNYQANGPLGKGNSVKVKLVGKAGEVIAVQLVPPSVP